MVFLVTLLVTLSLSAAASQNVDANLTQNLKSDVLEAETQTNIDKEDSVVEVAKQDTNDATSGRSRCGGGFGGFGGFGGGFPVSFNPFFPGVVNPGFLPGGQIIPGGGVVSVPVRSANPQMARPVMRVTPMMASPSFVGMG